MSRAFAQARLFEIPEALPPGLAYQPDFITPDEEEALLALFADLPFREALFQHTRRAGASFVSAKASIRRAMARRRRKRIPAGRFRTS